MRAGAAAVLAAVLVVAPGCADDPAPPGQVDARDRPGDQSQAGDARDVGTGQPDGPAGESGGPTEGGGPGGDPGATDGSPGRELPGDGPGLDGAADTPSGGDTPGGGDRQPPRDLAGGSDRVSMPCMAPGPCNPFDPASCPAGKICQPQTGGQTACIDGAPAPKGEGEPCTRLNECAPALMCVDIGDGKMATCRRMCPNGSIGFCPGAEERCYIQIVGETCVRVCAARPAPCDPYAQDCAAASETCTLASDPETGVPYTGCYPAGPQGIGEPCGGAAGTCGRGLICVREAGVATCKQLCRPGGGSPSCTAPGQTCSGMSSTWMVGYCR